MSHLDYAPAEARYGMPNADQILFNREYTVGYSYRIRQPKWVLEVIDSANSIDNISDRSNAFRPDHRIPPLFRVSDDDYEGSGYDRGHLIASANRLSSAISNSETFLMSNMSPQLASMNRGIWKKLEQRVRDLKDKNNIEEVYSIAGPVWSLGKTVVALDSALLNDVILPVPHLFFKCILSENHRGTFKMYAFMIPNEENLAKISDYQLSTRDVEIFTGLNLWSNLTGASIENQKNKKYKLWFDD